MTSAEDLIELGQELQSAKSQLDGLYDRLALDYDSVAAKQYRFTREGVGGYVEDLRANTREVTWELTVGSPMKCYENGALVTPVDSPKVGSIIAVEVQPAAVAAKDLLAKTRDTTETLLTMTGDDLDALASIPTILGRNNTSLGEISETLEGDINTITDLQNAVNQPDPNGHSWTGDGKEAYYSALTPQKSAFQECQDNVEYLIEADIALADITADLFVAFLNVRSAQLEGVQELGGIIFTLANPTNWLGLAQKIFDTVVDVKEQQVQEFKDKIQELAESAETKNVIEKAERTASMSWPEPPGGIGGTWSK